MTSVLIRLVLGSSKFSLRFADSTEHTSFGKVTELTMLKVVTYLTEASSLSNWSWTENYWLNLYV